MIRLMSTGREVPGHAPLCVGTATSRGEAAAELAAGIGQYAVDETTGDECRCTPLDGWMWGPVGWVWGDGEDS